MRPRDWGRRTPGGRTVGTEKASRHAWPPVGYGSWPRMTARRSVSGVISNARKTCYRLAAPTMCRNDSGWWPAGPLRLRASLRAWSSSAGRLARSGPTSTSSPIRGRTRRSRSTRRFPRLPGWAASSRSVAGGSSSSCPPTATGTMWATTRPCRPGRTSTSLATKPASPYIRSTARCSCTRSRSSRRFPSRPAFRQWNWPKVAESNSARSTSRSCTRRDTPRARSVCSTARTVSCSRATRCSQDHGAGPISPADPRSRWRSR